MESKNIEAVLFDLDDTLIDASPPVNERVDFTLTMPFNPELIFRIIYYVWKNIKLLNHDFYRLPKSINHKYTFHDIQRYVLQNITNFDNQQSVINIITHSLLDIFRYELSNNFLLREKYTHIHLKFKEQVLGQWILNRFHAKCNSIIKIKGGASDREYFRVFMSNNNTVVLMDSSLHNDNICFLAKSWLLKSINVPLPDIYAYNLKLGLILLEDLGDITLLEYLNEIKYEAEEISHIYKHALDLLKSIQVNYPNYKDLMGYDKKRIINEMSFFKKFFLEGLLEIKTSKNLELQLLNVILRVSSNIEKQAKTFVHIDYQSTNLMLYKNILYLLDFQGALYGHYTYDFVSLCKDNYYILPDLIFSELKEYFMGNLEHLDFYEREHIDIAYDIDCATIHRHLKNPGTFSFLCIEKNKPEYLRHIVNSIEYLLDVFEKYDSFIPLANFLLELNYENIRYKSKRQAYNVYIASHKFHYYFMHAVSSMVVVTGIASSGKTTLVKKLVESSTVPTTVISIDQIRQNIYFDYIYSKSCKYLRPYILKFGLLSPYLIHSLDIDYKKNLFISKIMNNIKDDERKFFVGKITELRKRLPLDKTAFFRMDVMQTTYVKITSALNFGYLIFIDVA